MKYVRSSVLFVVLGCLIFLVSPSSIFTASPDLDTFDRSSLRKIEPQVLRELEAAKGGQVNFIVQFHGKPDLSEALKGREKSIRRAETVRALKTIAERSQQQSLEVLARHKQEGKVETYQSLWIINGASVRGNRESVLTLAARPDVEMIRADRQRHLALPPETSAGLVIEGEAESQPETVEGLPLASPEWNVTKIGADSVWSALGIDGTGAVVASLDTGVDWQHPALTDKYRGNLGKGIVNHSGNWFDFTTDAFQYPADQHGHGTHVTGIMVGSDGTNQVGVAPGAKWIAAKVFRADGSSFDSWIHTAFQWILAPAGNPDLAPDIVNASWGSADGMDQFFQPDIAALLAAGITPVFAAGNTGPGSQTVNSPGSLDVAFAVGATDSTDLVAVFSSRGPSPWGTVKPDVSAPGVSIRSSYPGGAYHYMSGTSMATPHVAGLLALLEQANAGMTPLQALRVITSTAAPLGEGRPNNDYGWGRINAYAAVSAAMQGGILRGVVSSSQETPIAGAIVTATNESTGSPATAVTQPDGSYSVLLPVGFYNVEAGAFGYATSAGSRSAIESQGVVVRDFVLDPLPAGSLVGVVLEEGTGQPLTATVTIVGTPLVAQTGAATGAFTFSVPAGVWDVRVTSDRHRVQAQTGVTVAVSDTTALIFTLASAPSILLVDSGAWYGGSKIGYFRSALDSLDYAYAIRSITDTRRTPTTAEMSPYDIVIWSSPLDSPGYIDADRDLAAYLDGGGRLLLTGQDIGYYDGGGSILIDAPYFRDKLQAEFISDNAGIIDLVGSDSSIFSGITITLNALDSAQNQLFPDLIAPRGVRASSVIDYLHSGSGGIETDVCLPYRVVYLGFGLEGAGAASDRMAMLARSIDWLVGQPPAREVRVLPSLQAKVQQPGTIVTGTLTVWNTGSLSDTFTAAFAGSEWPISLWDESFTHPIATTGEITSCQAITIGVQVEIPAGEPKNASSSATISVISLSDPAIRQTAAVNVKTPAFILLVDDDRWYDVESSYKNVLFDLGHAYDIYDTRGGAGPDISTLGMYSITIWFTGYDWYQPLTTRDEGNLTSYLDQGGRLLLSSQDYLYVRGLDSFGANYMGVLSYTSDVTATQVNGVPGDIVGDGLGPYTLTMPYVGFKDWSDQLTPKPLASAAFLNVWGVPTGISNLDGGERGRVVFFAFPFEGLAAEPARLVMDRIIERALATDVKPSKRIVKPDDELRYEISLFNSGSVTATWTITSALPIQTSFVAGSLEGGAVYDAGNGRMLWQGNAAPGDTRKFAYRVRVQPDATGSIANATTFRRAGDEVFTRTSTISIGYSWYLPIVREGPTSGW